MLAPFPADFVPLFQNALVLELFFFRDIKVMAVLRCFPLPPQSNFPFNQIQTFKFLHFKEFEWEDGEFPK